ncbi:MAG: hypothetical protein B6I20_05435 [Bacteroidetes bacterium 4572_117]|nr:MAG: hypothetical protein B6I20_05435 [Bacteroidetes bacterium 4572_117]
MKITNQQKKIIVSELRKRQKNYESQSQMAKAFGVSAAQTTRILKGEVNRVLSDENFLRLATELGLDLRGYQWKTAKTPVFNKVYTQLQVCQNEGISAMLVDNAGVGKSYTAKEYVKENANAVYIDCSQVKTKLIFIKEIARKFGLNAKGRYADIYKDLVFYLNTSVAPLIILDEAGDLKPDAFLELKALWNATEGLTGYYMMGADGLRAVVERNIELRKIGYTELFRRFGERFQQVTPVGKEDLDSFKRQQLSLVAKANGMTNIQELYAKTGGSLTRLNIEFKKLKRRQVA